MPRRAEQRPRRSSEIGSPKRMKRPPLQVPTATWPSMAFTLWSRRWNSTPSHRAALIVALIFFLWLDLHFFARGREPSFKEAAWWSVGWLVLSLLAAIPVLILEGATTRSPTRRST